MKKKAFLIVALFLFVLMLVPIPGTVCAKSKAKPIVIGMIFDLTGPFAPVGITGSQGAKTAFDILGHEVAGRPVEFIIEDSGTDAGQSPDKARKLVTVDGASILILPVFGGATQAIAPYLDKVKVPGLLVEQAVPALALKHRWVWHPAGLEKQFVYPLGIFAYKNLGYRKVSLLAWEIGDGPEFMEGFKDGFVGSGGEIVQEVYYPPQTMDFGPYIIGMKKADALMGYFPGSNIFAFYQAKGSFGLDIPIMESPGEMPNPPIQAALGEKTVGTVFLTTYLWSLDTKGNKKFVKAYKERWGEPPSHISADAYRNIELIYEALNATKGDSSGEALAKAFSEMTADTIQGKISFTPENVAVRDLWIYKKESATGDPKKDYKLLSTVRTKSEKVGEGFKSVVLGWD